MSTSAMLKLAMRQQQEHAIILLDVNARVVAWLPGATKTFGWTEDEMRGETIARLFTPEDIARGDLEWEFRAAKAYGKSEDDRWQVRRDGLKIWVTGIVTALRDADGSLMGFCKICRDRTDIQTRIETLQSRVNRQEDLQREKHTMIGTLAHELRNPLAPLKNAAELIRVTSPSNPAVGTYVDIIERQIRFIESVLTDLLESARVGMGKTKLDYARFELQEAIDAALETCSPMLKDRRQTIDVLIPGRVALEADFVRVQQVIVNLVANSSKFSPAGAKIWIKATVDSDELVLRVEDHGQGISTDLLPQIFDLLTQAGSEGSAFGRGLGLGLALVKSIVEMHGGSVQARSEGIGKGAEIIVRLPLCRESNRPTASTLRT